MSFYLSIYLLHHHPQRALAHQPFGVCVGPSFKLTTCRFCVSHNPGVWRIYKRQRVKSGVSMEEGYSSNLFNQFVESNFDAIICLRGCFDVKHRVAVRELRSFFLADCTVPLNMKTVEKRLKTSSLKVNWHSNIQFGQFFRKRIRHVFWKFLAIFRFFNRAV